MSDPPTKASIEDVLAEFERRQETLAALCARTKSLIEASLQDVNINYQSVQARVKTRKKLQKKYLDPERDYQRLDDITDLAGLRVITYYEDDVDRAVQVMKQEFAVDSENSIDKRETDPDRFGYSGVNLICKHAKKRTQDVEYRKFEGLCCEIQVTSILGHAWSEIEHEWYDLKDAYPDKIKRRFSRLAALFDLADSEFRDIRKERSGYERSVAVRVQTMSSDIAIDPVSLRPFIAQEPLVAEIDAALSPLIGLPLSDDVPDASLRLRSDGLKFAGLLTIQELKTSLEKHKTQIPEFVRRCKAENLWGPRGKELSKSVSLWHLALLLLSLRGAETITQFYRTAGVSLSSNIDRQVAIAKEIVGGQMG